MSMGGQGTKWRRNTAENLNRLSSAHERYRRQTDNGQTDGRAMTCEREREFTFAKNWLKINRYILRVKCSPKNLVLAIYYLLRYSQGITPSDGVEMKRPLTLGKI